jgi:hypothetical protein
VRLSEDTLLVRLYTAVHMTTPGKTRDLECSFYLEAVGVPFRAAGTGTRRIKHGSRMHCCPRMISGSSVEHRGGCHPVYGYEGEGAYGTNSYIY